MAPDKGPLQRVFPHESGHWPEGFRSLAAFRDHSPPLLYLRRCETGAQQRAEVPFQEIRYLCPGVLSFPDRLVVFRDFLRIFRSLLDFQKVRTRMREPVPAEDPNKYQAENPDPAS